jgi:hypothetical protein
VVGPLVQTKRTRSTAMSALSSRSAAPSSRDASSDSASASERSLALRAAAEAGLFSSCARPAASLPSEAIFST